MPLDSRLRGDYKIVHTESKAVKPQLIVEQYKAAAGIARRVEYYSTRQF